MLMSVDFVWLLRQLFKKKKKKGDNAVKRLGITVGEVPSLELEKG